MDVDTTAVRRWLLNEAHALQQQQQETTRLRLESVRAIIRLVKAHEIALADLPKGAAE